MTIAESAHLEIEEQVKLHSMLIDFLEAIVRSAQSAQIQLNAIEQASLIRDYRIAKVLKDRAGQLRSSEEKKLIDLFKQNWFRYETTIPDSVKSKLFDRVLSKHRQEVIIKRILFKLSSELSDNYTPAVEGKFNQLQACLEKLENGPLLVIDELKIFNSLEA